MFFGHNGNDNPISLQIRAYTNGVWQPWSKILQSGEDISVSHIQIRGADYPGLHIYGTSSNTPSAGFQTVISENRVYITEHCLDSSYYEQYYLPAPNKNATSHGYYTILTSKEVVSIAQGGTGANTKADAANNLLKYGTKNGNINDRLSSGYYWLQLPSCINTPYGDNPTGHYGFLEVVNALSSDVLQRFTQYHDGDTWVRTNVNGWQNWVRYLTSNNYTSYTVGKTGSGASGTWGINITGNAGSASCLGYINVINGNSHAAALKNEFDANKGSIPRNSLISYYSTAYGNGSYYMGYFLYNHDSTPYGGFYVAHYNNPYYVGILAGSYYEQLLLTSTNYSSYALPISGGTMAGCITLASTGIQTNNIAGYYTDQYGNFFHSRSSTGDHWQFHSYDQSISLKYYSDLGILNAPALATLNYGSGAPGSSTRGHGHAGAIYYQI